MRFAVRLVLLRLLFLQFLACIAARACQPSYNSARQKPLESFNQAQSSCTQDICCIYLTAQKGSSELGESPGSLVPALASSVRPVFLEKATSDGRISAALPYLVILFFSLRILFLLFWGATDWQPTDSVRHSVDFWSLPPRLFIGSNSLTDGKKSAPMELRIDFSFGEFCLRLRYGINPWAFGMVSAKDYLAPGEVRFKTWLSTV